MEKDYNSIAVNQEIFTIDDAKEAAKQLFESQVDDFYALKNEKWYKHLLNAITFGSDRKKKVIKDIRSLSKLQTIFMRVYCENYKDLDSQLNEIIENVAKTNESVKKIYVNYIVGVKSQQSILDLSQLEQDILLLLLCSYSSNNGNNDNLKKYRAGIARTIGRGIPQGEFTPEKLEKIKSSEVIYRLIVEMCAIDGGLDDFSIPDNIYEAIDYLTISNKAKESIQSQVREELDNFGVDYLIEKYGASEEEDIIDEDVDLTDEGADNEDFATIIIDKEVRIAEGQQQIYKNKEILIHANVICEGELLFDNCTLKYNDCAIPGKIQIKEKGKLNITGCTFICLSYKDDYFFECDGEVIIKYTKFLDCSYLFKASKDFYVEHCEMVNCAMYLFELDACDKSRIIICKNKIIQNDWKQFYKERLRGGGYTMITVYSGRSYGGIVEFNNNIIKEMPGFAEIFKAKAQGLVSSSLIYIESDSKWMSITQSTFINASGGINASNIEECYFKGCKKPIIISCTNEHSKIENCIFEECEDVISEDKSAAIIRSCQFISCKNRLIDCQYAFDGGVIVDSCVFKNVQNDFNGEDSRLYAAWNKSALKFERSKSIESKENRIVNCYFDGVEMKKAFLIAADGKERPREDTVISVYNCSFSHCVTQRESKKLIREYFTYCGLFNKEKSVHATQISYCKGLDKINSEGSKAENLSINYTSSSGRTIGADLTLLE